MLNVVAPPIFASPALAALMGLNAAVTLALLLACIAVTPFLAPALVALFVGPAVTFSPLALGLRLVLMLAGAACVGIAVRSFAGKAWVERQAERIDGLNVVVLFLFAVALMGDVAANTIARPLFVLGLLALSTAVTFGLSGLTALIFARAGPAHRAAARARGGLPQHRPDAGGRGRRRARAGLALCGADPDSDLRAAADHEAAAAQACSAQQPMTLASNAQVRRWRRQLRLQADQLLQQIGEVRRLRIGRAAAPELLDAAGVVISTFVPSA